MKDGKKAEAASVSPAKGGKGKLLIFAAVPLLLAAAGGAVWYFDPGLLHGAQPAKQDVKTAAAAQAAKPLVLDLPEMVVTLPNGGQARQLRIKFTIELGADAHDLPPMALLTPRVNDALLAYLRTLRDGDLEGGLAIDRIRGDLYRRLTLILGPDAVKDVLITSLVTG